MRLRKWSVVAASFATALGVGVVTASADSAPFTRGDAEALFNAGGDAGVEVTLHGGVIEGAPAPSGHRIGPGQNFQGFHVCATDWHVMFIRLIVSDATDNVHNLAEANAVFDTIAVTYQLDGAPLAIDVSSVTPFLNPTSVDPAATVAFSQASGAILAPEALSVGAHTERVRIYIDGLLFDDLGDVTFFVDAAGTGACL